MDGKRLRQLRKTAHLTQQELGERLGTTGASVSDWERGKIPIPRMALPLIEQTFGISEGSRVAEPPERYLTPRQKRMAGIFEELVSSNDDEILNHLERQHRLILDLMRRRKGRK